MRSRLCNDCKKWTPVTDWDYGCPHCGCSNGRGDVNYSEFPGVEVIDDIPRFKSPSGVYIEGRSQWREHLKRTDTIEMGHSDMAWSKNQWGKRKDAHNDRLRGAVETVTAWSHPTEKQLEAPIRRNDLQIEMANRLHGRPMPDRKTMIKLTLDEMKRMNRNR